MRLLLFYLFFLYSSASVYAINEQDSVKTIYGCYGFNKLPSEKEYKNWIGRKFVYIPSRHDQDIGRNLKLDAEKEYFVDQVDVLGKNCIQLQYCASEDIEKKYLQKIYFNRKKPSVSDLPIVFKDLVDKEIRNATGKYLTNRNAENKFQIEHVAFEYLNDTSEYQSIVYYVKDEYTKKTHRLSDMNVDYTGLSKKLFKHMNVASLVSVEKPTDPLFRYGEITKTILRDSLAFRFTDDNISVVLLPIYMHIYTHITNSSPHTLRILWHEGSFVDTEGKSSSIIHMGVKYIEKEKLQTPTIIISGAWHSDMITPTENIRIKKGELAWEVIPFYDSSTPIEEAKTMKLMLPIQIDGVVNDYIFTFRVRDEFIFPGVVRVGEKAPLIPNSFGLDKQMWKI